MRLRPWIRVVIYIGGVALAYGIVSGNIVVISLGILWVAVSAHEVLYMTWRHDRPLRSIYMLSILVTLSTLLMWGGVGIAVRGFLEDNWFAGLVGVVCALLSTQVATLASRFWRGRL